MIRDYWNNMCSADHPDYAVVAFLATMGLILFGYFLGRFTSPVWDQFELEQMREKYRALDRTLADETKSKHKWRIRSEHLSRKLRGVRKHVRQLDLANLRFKEACKKDRRLTWREAEEAMKKARESSKVVLIQRKHDRS